MVLLVILQRFSFGKCSKPCAILQGVIRGFRSSQWTANGFPGSRSLWQGDKL